MRRVLLYGGTFDPPHLGHVHVPKEAMNSLAFDGVLYVPAFQSPLKETTPTSAHHRTAMLTLSLAECPWATIETLEIERGNTSFTIDTIEKLHGSYDEIRLLIGADQWQNFQQWYRWEDIIRLANPAIMPRAGFAVHNSNLLHIEPLYGASSDIRKRIRTGDDWRGDVHPEVAKYIANNKLYL